MYLLYSVLVFCCLLFFMCSLLFLSCLTKKVKSNYLRNKFKKSLNGTAFAVPFNEREWKGMIERVFKLSTRHALGGRGACIRDESSQHGGQYSGDDAAAQQGV